MNKPKILNRGAHSVKISWKNVFPSSEIYVMEILDDLLGWKQTYWGPRTECVVSNLAPCTCYNFRLKPEGDENWLNFKAATDVGPFLIMHMNRAVKFGKVPLLRKLVQSRPSLLELENKEFRTPLMQVAESGDVTMATYLINFGANVNTTTIHTNKSPLMVAVFYGHLKLAGLLVEKGADVFAMDNNKFNILHYAVNANNLDSVKFCLGNGLNINSRDSMGFTPLIRAAILNCSKDLIVYLFGNGADADLKDRAGFNFEKHCKILNRDDLIGLVPKKTENKDQELTVCFDLEEDNLKRQFYIKPQ